MGIRPDEPTPNAQDILHAGQALGNSTGPYPGDTTSGDAALDASPNIRNMQRFLRKQGYNIPITGVNDQRTRDAKKNWSSGVKNRNPWKWNKQRGVGQLPNFDYSKYKPAGGGGGGSGDGGSGGGDDSISGLGAVGAAAQSTNNAMAKFMRRLAKITKQGGGVGQMIPEDLINQLKDSNSKIEKYAKELYNINVKNLKAQNNQNVADIQAWYGDASKQFNIANERDAAINARSIAEMGAVQQGLVSSLGGSANPASATVAAAGNAGNAMLRSIGAAEEQYTNDMAPLITQEGAGMSSRQRALLSQQLAQLGNEFASGSLERRASNDDELVNMQLAILQANNALSQQRYQNVVGGTSNELAALMSMPDLTAKQLDNILRGLSIDNAQLQNQMGQEQLNAAQPGEFVPWAQYTPEQKQGLLNSVITYLSQAFPPDRSADLDAVIKAGYNYMIRVAGINNPGAQAQLAEMIRNLYT